MLIENLNNWSCKKICPWFRHKRFQWSTVLVWPAEQVLDSILFFYLNSFFWFRLNLKVKIVKKSFLPVFLATASRFMAEYIYFSQQMFHNLLTNNKKLGREKNSSLFLSVNIFQICFLWSKRRHLFKIFCKQTTRKEKISSIKNVLLCLSEEYF